jgi:hypothetical protein
VKWLRGVDHGWLKKTRNGAIFNKQNTYFVCRAMPFHRKRVRAIDPHNQDNKRREAYMARFLPKSYDLAPKGDDSDVESTVFRDGKGPQRKKNQKRKERDFDFEEEEPLVPKTKAPGDFSAKKVCRCH